MKRTQLRVAVGFATLFALVTAGGINTFAQDTAARQKSAREAALAYAQVHNAALVHKQGAGDDLLKVAAFPFFAGRVDGLLRGGPPNWIRPVVFKKDEELRKHFSQWQGVLGPGRLPVEVQG